MAVFCRAGRTSGEAAKFAREARENEQRSRVENKNRLPGFEGFLTAAPFTSFWHPRWQLVWFQFPQPIIGLIVIWNFAKVWRVWQEIKTNRNPHALSSFSMATKGDTPKKPANVQQAISSVNDNCRLCCCPLKIKYGELKKKFVYFNAKPFQGLEARRMHTRSDFGRTLFTYWTGNWKIRHVLWSSMSCLW